MQELEAVLQSLQACRAALNHADCDLEILDSPTRTAITQLHELENRSRTMQSTYPTLSSTNTAGGCYESSIRKPSPFMGNSGEVALLSDNSIWKVVNQYEYLYEYYPSVVACPDRSLLIIGDKKLSAQLLAGGGSRVTESSVSGSWDGWNGDTIVRLVNGQIWEQVGAALSLSLGLENEVFIYKLNGAHFMMVEGEKEAVAVSRLK